MVTKKNIRCQNDRVNPIKSEKEGKLALKELEYYFDNQPKLGTPEENRFLELIDIIEIWEAPIRLRIKKFQIRKTSFMIKLKTTTIEEFELKPKVSHEGNIII